mgnify:CR=1 FL=1
MKPQASRADGMTLPRLLQRNARDFGNRPAIREKDRGIWQTWTWREYHDQVHDLALGLAALGFRRGDRLSVIGDNRPRLYWAQVAALCLGGVPVPVYQDSIAKELAFVWNHAEISVIVAEDQEQVDKVLSLREELPALRLVVYDDARGMSGYKHDWLKSYEHVQEAGRKFGAEHPGYVEAEIGKGQPADTAIISLHLRHDRQSQGRDDLPRQCHRRGRELCTGGGAQARGHVAGLSADGVGG